MIWKERATPRSQMRYVARAWIASPCSRTVPWFGGNNPETILNRVVLPAPLGPISAWIWPASMRRLAFDTACMPPKCLDTLSTSSSVPVCTGGRRNAGKGSPSMILRALIAAASSSGGFQRRINWAQMPISPPGEYITKPTNTSPNQNSQLELQIESSSRNRTKNTEPRAGPRMLCMPPMTTMASISPENATDTASADTRKCRNPSSAPASPVTIAEITNATSR